ncbi:hypothetical protein D3C72_1936300 [compost metagenome]
MALQHLGLAAHGVGEGVEDVARGPVQQHLDEDQQGPVRRGRVDQGRIAGDDLPVLQPLDPLEAGGGRQIAPSRQFRVGDAAVNLQNAQQSPVGIVKNLHGE